jgi:hypothetical protein
MQRRVVERWTLPVAPEEQSVTLHTAEALERPLEPAVIGISRARIARHLEESKIESPAVGSLYRWVPSIEWASRMRALQGYAPPGLHRAGPQPDPALGDLGLGCHAPTEREAIAKALRWYEVRQGRSSMAAGPARAVDRQRKEPAR